MNNSIFRIVLSFFMVLLLIFTCKQKQDNWQHIDDNNLTLVPLDTNSNTVDKVNKEWENIANIDTLIAYFLFSNYDRFEPSYYKEYYQKYDIEYPKHLDLIKTIFKNEKSLSVVIDSIEHIRNEFIIYSRQKVISDLYKYHGISGMDFSFLLHRNDSVVLKISDYVMNNDSVSETEKEYYALSVARFFGDSSFLHYRK